MPSDLAHLLMAFRYQFLLYLRTQRFLGLLGFVLTIIGALVLGTIYLGAEGASAAADIGADLGYFTAFAVVVCAFMGGDAISMDLGGGTGYYVLSLPIRRTTLLLGRYVAAFVATMLLIGAYFIVAVAAASWIHGVGDVPWSAVGASFGLAALFSLGVLSVAFCFSSLFRNPAVSLIATVAVLFFGLGTATGELPAAGIQPWFSVLYGGLTVETVIPTKARTLFGPVTSPGLLEGVAIMVAYAIVFLIASLIVYQLQEWRA